MVVDGWLRLVVTEVTGCQHRVVTVLVRWSRSVLLVSTDGTTGRNDGWMVTGVTDTWNWEPGTPGT